MAKIIGNTTATPNPCPDWEQTNSTKADFIKNKPEIKSGDGKDSIVQNYTGECDSTHFGNTSTGESAAVFGEANINGANRALIVGKLNENSGANAIVGGIFNKTKSNSGTTVGYENINDGENSVVGGSFNEVDSSASNSIVGGAFNKVKGSVCGVTSGTYNTIDGHANNVSGTENIVHGAHNVVSGRKNRVYVNNSVVIGKGLNVLGLDHKCVVGRYNLSKPNTILEVGNGSEETPSNAFEVYEDGTTNLNLGSSSSTAIIDVEALPTENINRNAFYRVREKIALLNGVSHFFGSPVIVKKVETLPTVGEFTEDRLILYYQTSDNEVYLYYNAWMTLAELCALTELSYGGQVSSKEEAAEVNTVYITNGDYDIYSYTDKWNKLNETKNGVKVANLYGYDNLFAWLRENCRTKNILKVAVGHWDVSGFCVHELLQNPTFGYSLSEHDFDLTSATFTLFDSGWKIDESGHIYKQVVERTFAKPSDYPAHTVSWTTINLRYQSDGTATTIVNDDNPAYTPYGAEETCFVTYTDNDEAIKIV